MKLEKSTGSLTISSVVTDSDTTITGQVGDVVLNEVNITGDLSVYLEERDQQYLVPQVATWNSDIQKP